MEVSVTSLVPSVAFPELLLRAISQDLDCMQITVTNVDSYVPTDEFQPEVVSTMKCASSVVVRIVYIFNCTRLQALGKNSNSDF